MDHIAGFHVASGGGDKDVDRIVAFLGQSQQVGCGFACGFVVDAACDDHVAAFEKELLYRRDCVVFIVFFVGHEGMSYFCRALIYRFIAW